MIRILLVERIQLVSEVVGAALEGEPDMHVSGVAGDLPSVIEQLEQSECDLVLASTSLADDGALDVVRYVRANVPEVKVLVIGLADVEAVIMKYIEAGAFGYVLREDGVAELMHNVRAAVDDQALVSPDIAGRLMHRIMELTDQLEQAGVSPDDLEDLTPREYEILQLIGAGLSNQEISSRLTIEIGTVKNHVHNILNKLHVNSRKDAALYASLVENSSASRSDKTSERETKN